MRANKITLCALIYATITALPLVSEVSRRQAPGLPGLPNPLYISPPITFSEPQYIPPEEVLPRLEHDLKYLQSFFPQDAPSTIAQINKLLALATSVVGAQISNLLYLPVGFFYGNPLIPFSGILPGVLSSALGLAAGIPPLPLPAAATPLVAPLVAPLKQILPTILAAVKLPDPRYGLLGDEDKIPAPAIPTDILQKLPSVVPAGIAPAIPAIVPTRALPAVGIP
ncbi:hypothetical protein OPT61_g8285 [Boeremia exigua]|uniref:Uncharacterized protein n=1 Tax=Boeremia exigua TaxID=749465 RepID=A0ACC2HZ77_9PLEO|nr:hypothetical protein OPT61_g8285 [Boeremia exigua]